MESAVDELTAKGVAFERYEGTPIQTDEKGVFRGGGPLIAWFTDPAGNVLSVIQTEASPRMPCLRRPGAADPVWWR